MLVVPNLPPQLRDVEYVMTPSSVGGKATRYATSLTSSMMSKGSMYLRLSFPLQSNLITP